MDVTLKHRLRRGTTVLLVALACLSLTSPRAAAQSATSQVERPSARWVLVDAIGYGGLGTLAGVVAAAAMPSDAFIMDGAQLVAIGAGAVLGVLAGASIGSEARQRIRNGQPVSGVHGSAVKFGAVLAGATAGAILSAPIIIAGSELNRDTEVFSVFAISGALLGAVYASRHREELESNRMSIAPVHLPRAGYGLRVAVGF